MISKMKVSKIKMGHGKKIIRMSLLALLLVSLPGLGAVLCAQEQPASPPQPRQSPDSSPSSLSSSGSSRQPGFARQLSRETREAAGEETDDKAQFKQSAAVQFIARHTGLSTGSAYLLCVLLNFATIAGIILWASFKYLPGVFSARTAAIQKAMGEAQKASEEARRKLAEIESRLMKLDVEIGMMRDAAEKEATAEESRIQAAAREDARKLLESTQQEIASAVKAARRELTAYAADLAVALAQKQIRVDAATDQALVRNFAGELGVLSLAKSGSAKSDSAKSGSPRSNDAPGKGGE
ncbi:MAG: ATP synthase F0 subunit B [Candidatus Sulfotelmatobacter sp.]